MNIIKGSWVAIREMEDFDAPMIVSWRNRPDVAKWLVQWEPLTVETHLQWFQKAKRKGEFLLVFTGPNDQQMGTASIYLFDYHRICAEWGRLCTAENVGNPFAIIEACYLIHRFAFEILGLRRIHCGCGVENESAYRLNTFLGYVKEGLRRKHLLTPQGYRDVVEFGMFSYEFEMRRKAIEKRIYKHEKYPVFNERVAYYLAARFQ